MALREWWTARRAQVLDWMGPDDPDDGVEDWQLAEIRRRAEALVEEARVPAYASELVNIIVAEAEASGDWDATEAKWRKTMGVGR